MVTVHGTKMLAPALAASNGGAVGGRTLSEQAPQARVDGRRQSVFSSLISLLEVLFAKVCTTLI